MHHITILDLTFAFATETEFSTVARAVAKRSYRPLYRTLIGSAASAFGLPSFNTDPGQIFKEARYVYEEEGGEGIFPELFFRDNYLIAVVPLKETTRLILIRHHTSKNGTPPFEQDFIECIQSEVDGRRTKNWRPEVPLIPLKELPRVNNGRTGPDRFSDLVLNPASYTTEEAEMAEVMSQDHLRNAIIGIARSVKTKLGDAEKDLTKQQIEQLKNHRLVRTEYLVQCRGNSSTLCTVTDKDDLVINHGNKLRCPHCNRLFKDELVTDVLSLSDECKRLLDKSHWMTVWITKLIVISGVPVQHISWNASLQSDEIDIVVDIFGSKVFFELKDREFGLGDAFPFNHRFHRYGGDHGAIVTTDSIATEAEKFFKEQSSSRSSAIRFFSRGTDLAVELQRYVEEIAIRTLIAQLTRHLTISGVNEVPWIREWLK